MVPLTRYHACESVLNFKTVPVLPSLNPSLAPFCVIMRTCTGAANQTNKPFSFIFPFQLLPSPVHPIGFSFYFFPGFLAIFILLSLNNNNMHNKVHIFFLHCTFCQTENSEHIYLYFSNLNILF